MILRSAELSDIPAIMQLERGEGYAALVGRWSQEGHEAEFAKPDSGYLLAEGPGGPLGFVMLQRLDEPLGNVLLRRIAVAQPGQGVGRALLHAAAGFAFARPLAHRLYLRAHSGNARAIAAYARFGFKHEGVERQSHRHADGAREDNVLMSLLRPEWEARA